MKAVKILAIAIAVVFVFIIVMKDNASTANEQLIPAPSSVSLNMQMISALLDWLLAACAYFSLVGSIYFVVWAEYKKEKMKHDEIMEKIKRDYVERIHEMRNQKTTIMNPGRSNETIISSSRQ